MSSSAATVRPDGDLIVMSRNMQVVVQVEGKDRESYRRPTAPA